MENGGAAHEEAMAAEGATILGTGAEQALEKALFGIGATCSECGRATYDETMDSDPDLLPVVYEFALATARIEEGRPKVVVSRAYACVRDDCEGIEKLKTHPDVIAMRTVPTWIPMAPPKPDPAKASE